MSESITHTAPPVQAALSSFLHLALTEEEKALLREEFASRTERLSLLLGVRSILCARARRLGNVDLEVLDTALLELVAQPDT